MQRRGRRVEAAVDPRGGFREGLLGPFPRDVVEEAAGAEEGDDVGSRGREWSGGGRGWSCCGFGRRRCCRCRRRLRRRRRRHHPNSTAQQTSSHRLIPREPRHHTHAPRRDVGLRKARRARKRSPGKGWCGSRRRRRHQRRRNCSSHHHCCHFAPCRDGARFARTQQQQGEAVPQRRGGRAAKMRRAMR